VYRLFEKVSPGHAVRIETDVSNKRTLLHINVFSLSVVKTNYFQEKSGMATQNICLISKTHRSEYVPQNAVPKVLGANLSEPIHMPR